MKNVDYVVEAGGHPLEMIFVEGTGEEPYFFGNDGARRPISIKNFLVSKTQVTQDLWRAVMAGADPSHFKGERRPVEHVSFDDITLRDGFLDRLNAAAATELAETERPHRPRFRLPSETEWEYAARGGKFWKDNYLFSGGDNPHDVAWFLENSGRMSHPVGEKLPNQLGIHDMCGNVWEWCEDLMVRDTSLIPADGTAYLASGTDRILRGGCHHNGAVHCTVSKRYEITPTAADECIGFRVVLGL